MSEAPIRVAIVDDSSLARGLLRAILEQEADIQVVGEAANGQRAVELVRDLQPSLVTMDLEMPVMGGLEAIETIMSTKAVPILVVSSVADARNACEALRLGALDVMTKPDYTAEQAAEFIAKVRLLANMVVITRWRTPRPDRARPAPRPLPVSLPAPRPAADGSEPPTAWERTPNRIFAIASSTGGPQALARILPRLPPAFPGLVIVAQHVVDGFAAGMAEWLAGLCALPVRLAQDGERLQPGRIYLSPSERHLTVGPDCRAVLRARAARDLYRPSCDALLDSVADGFGRRSVGIILTGMGSDGALGLARIRARGGLALAQDEATSVIYGMNRVAVESGAVDRILPLDDIAGEIRRLAGMETLPCAI